MSNESQSLSPALASNMFMLATFGETTKRDYSWGCCKLFCKNPGVSFEIQKLASKGTSCSFKLGMDFDQTLFRIVQSDLSMPH